MNQRIFQKWTIGRIWFLIYNTRLVTSYLRSNNSNNLKIQMWRCGTVPGSCGYKFQMFGKSKSARFTQAQCGTDLGPGCYDVDRADNALKIKTYGVVVGTTGRFLEKDMPCAKENLDSSNNDNPRKSFVLNNEPARMRHIINQLNNEKAVLKKALETQKTSMIESENKNDELQHALEEMTERQATVLHSLEESKKYAVDLEENLVQTLSDLKLQGILREIGLKKEIDSLQHQVFRSLNDVEFISVEFAEKEIIMKEFIITLEEEIRESDKLALYFEASNKFETIRCNCFDLEEELEQIKDSEMLHYQIGKLLGRDSDSLQEENSEILENWLLAEKVADDSRLQFDAKEDSLIIAREEISKLETDLRINNSMLTDFETRCRETLDMLEGQKTQNLITVAEQERLIEELRSEIQMTSKESASFKENYRSAQKTIETLEEELNKTKEQTRSVDLAAVSDVQELNEVIVQLNTKYRELQLVSEKYKAMLIAHNIDSKDVELEMFRALGEQATSEAERLAEENAVLAGNQNPKQKIKYLKRIKLENTHYKLENAKLAAQVLQLRQKIVSTGASDSGHALQNSSSRNKSMHQYESRILK